MSEMAEFLAARYDEREQIALAASSEHRRQATKPEHWRWECAEDDEPLDVDLAIASNDELLKHGEDHYRVGLRSVEEYPSSVGMLCHLVTDSEEVSPQVARHIALNDPARVLREVEAGRTLMRYYGSPVGFPGEEGAPGLVMRALAAVFSDHPDYKPEWKL